MEYPDKPVSFRWKQLREQVLTRTVPHTMVSWRFLLPNQSRAVKLHRKVFLGAWPQLPRWQWALIALYSSMTWLLFFSWRQIYRCMQADARKLPDEYGIPVWKQLFDMLALALGHGVPPYFYSYYALYRKPREQWFQYVYSHELPHWHRVLSAGVSRQTEHLMTDKCAFSTCMADLGIASVETYAFLPRSAKVGESALFSGQSLFIKPNAGSRGEGAYALSFDAQTGQYRLTGDKVIEETADILDHINRSAAQQDYLIQPLLQNHPEIEQLCGSQELVFLRVVTGIIDGEAEALFATLLVPCLNEYNIYWWVDVELSSGRLLPDKEYIRFDDLPEKIGKIEGKVLPFRQDVVEICCRAHRHFSDLPCIGWDVAITPSGVKLLEGNFNWGVAMHQRRVPALATALLDVYR